MLLLSKKIKNFQGMINLKLKDFKKYFDKILLKINKSNFVDFKNFKKYFLKTKKFIIPL
jgi:hypothetical protein